MCVSIVIPTWNEASCIAQTVRDVRALKPHEIIVVDGGSTDATVGLAHEADHVLTTKPGRAFQMNAGAQAATGDYLLFLHADCRLQRGAIQAIERMLAPPAILAGCFSMRVEADGFAYRAIDACATARVRFTGIVYGDQGLFLRRRDFGRLGGFPPFRFMEDVLLSQKLVQEGRVVVLTQRIFVSPRRWQKVGLVRQTLRNWTLTALAVAGVPPNRLAGHYPQVR